MPRPLEVTVALGAGSRRRSVCYVEKRTGSTTVQLPLCVYILWLDDVVVDRVDSLRTSYVLLIR